MNTTQKESYALAMGEEWADGLDALPHHMHGGVVRPSPVRKILFGSCSYLRTLTSSTTMHPRGASGRRMCTMRG